MNDTLTTLPQKSIGCPVDTHNERVKHIEMWRSPVAWCSCRVSWKYIYQKAKHWCLHMNQEEDGHM